MTDSSSLSNAKIIARGASIAMIGAVAYKGLNYLFVLIVARGVGPGPFGLFRLGLAICSFLSIVALFGLDRGGLRYVARLRALGDTPNEVHLARRLILAVVVLGGAIGASIILLAKPIAQYYSDGSNFDTIIVLVPWFAFSIPLLALLLLTSAISDGQKRIEIGVLSRDILQPASAIVLAWILLWSTGNLVGAVQGYVVSLMLAVLLTLYLLRAYFMRSPAFSHAPKPLLFQEVLGFSLPFLPLTLLRQFGNQLEIYLLGFLSAPEAIGVFGVAASTASLVAFGLSAVTKIYSTLAAELDAKNEMSQLEYLLRTTTRWSTSISLPIMIALLLFAKDMMSAVGKEFAAGEIVLLILAVGQLVNAVTGPVGVTLNMTGHSRLALVNNLVALILNIVLDWWMITRWGILGAAIGSAIVISLLNIVVTLEVRLLLGIRSFDRSMLRPGLAGGLTLLMMWLVRPLLGSLFPLARVMVGLAFLATVYSAALWMLAPSEDRDVVKSAWLRARSLTLSLRLKP